MSNLGQYTWPEGVHGMCGDPAAGPLRHEAGGDRWTGTARATYSEGAVLNMTVYVAAFHKGRFSFRICRISGTGGRGPLCINTGKQRLGPTQPAVPLVVACLPPPGSPHRLRSLASVPSQQPTLCHAGC